MFEKTRLKLTAWYLLIIMCVSMSFSLVIYKTLTDEVERFARSQRFRIERQLQDGRIFTQGIREAPFILPLTDIELVEETKRRIILLLSFINGGIFVISGLLGYFLAGKTLRPIQIMVDEQNQFISDASHEFRTPLTSLKSAMEVSLRDKKFSLSDAKKLIAENIEEVNKLQKMSDGLLELTQLEKPASVPAFSRVDLVHSIKIAVQKVTPLAKKKRITVKTAIDPISLEAQTDHLITLLVILLDNAIKYSSQKQSIYVQAKQKENQLFLTVKDLGIGIDQKDLPHIFDRFYRADAARSKTMIDGYGLGLSIAKKIAESHHGTIEVVSIKGKGSTFTVRVPLKQNS